MYSSQTIERRNHAGPDRDELRYRVMGGLISEPELGTAIPDKSGEPKNSRQIRRLVAKGMPYVQIGRERFYDPDQVREWLATQVRSRRSSRLPAPRGRGRPGIYPRGDNLELSAPRTRGRPRNDERELRARRGSGRPASRPS
jgi:hypothetical protein